MHRLAQEEGTKEEKKSISARVVLGLAVFLPGKADFPVVFALCFSLLGGSVGEAPQLGILYTSNSISPKQTQG